MDPEVTVGGISKVKRDMHWCRIQRFCAWQSLKMGVMFGEVAVKSKPIALQQKY